MDNPECKAAIYIARTARRRHWKLVARMQWAVLLLILVAIPIVVGCLR